MRENSIFKSTFIIVSFQLSSAFFPSHLSWEYWNLSYKMIFFFAFLYKKEVEKWQKVMIIIVERCIESLRLKFIRHHHHHLVVSMMIERMGEVWEGDLTWLVFETFSRTRILTNCEVSECLYHYDTKQARHARSC